MSKCGVLATIILSIITAVLNIVAGVYILITWEDNEWCWVWTGGMLIDDDDYYNNYRYDACNEGLWAALAFIDAALFVVVTALLFVFFCRMDKLIAQQKAEMATVDATIVVRPQQTAGVVYASKTMETEADV